MEDVTLLIFAVIVDALIGDPSWLPHPVRLIGRAVEKGEQWLRQGPSSPGQDFLFGLGLVVGLVSVTYTVGALVLQVFGALSWWLEYVASVLLGSLCLARRSLKEHAYAVFHPLCAGDLAGARAIVIAECGLWIVE